MRVLLRVRPYEEIKGSANHLYKHWVEKCKKFVISGKHKLFVKNIKNIIKDFDNLKIKDIICMQPFACLPNHITGKGMIKELKYRYPEANITAADYDPSASQVK